MYKRTMNGENEEEDNTYINPVRWLFLFLSIETISCFSAIIFWLCYRVHEIRGYHQMIDISYTGKRLRLVILGYFIIMMLLSLIGLIVCSIQSYLDHKIVVEEYEMKDIVNITTSNNTEHLIELVFWNRDLITFTIFILALVSMLNNMYRVSLNTR